MLGDVHGAGGVGAAGKTRRRIALSELPLPTPPPEGAEWIVAYRYWRTGALR